MIKLLCIRETHGFAQLSQGKREPGSAVPYTHNGGLQQGKSKHSEPKTRWYHKSSHA